MKHRVIFRKLGRKTSHRTAMLRNLTTSLIEHDRIRTTVTRAKEVRRVADQMVTLAKKGTDYARQRAAVTVKTDAAMEKLFDTIAGRYKDRNGGYTRIMRCGYRDGDKAPMCYIEFVDREGELRLSRKVGNEKEEVIFDSAAMKKEASSSAESVEEQIRRIDDLSDLEVKLPQESSHASSIEFK